MKLTETVEASLVNFLPYKIDKMRNETKIYWIFFVAMCAMYLIGVDDALAAGAAPDPAAPLEMLKTARTKASTSNLSVASATTGAGNVANMILIAMGMVGVGASAYSGYSLYNNIQQGEQARGSNMTFTVALVVGAMLTLIAIIIGVITNFVTTSAA